MTSDTNYRENANPGEEEKDVYISLEIFLVSGRSVKVTRRCRDNSFASALDSGTREMQKVLNNGRLYPAGFMLVNVTNITHVECKILTQGGYGLVLHEEYMNKWDKEAFGTAV